MAMTNVQVWIKEKCSKCPKNPKCQPYSEEMLLCILAEINKRERINLKEKEDAQAEVIR